MERSQWMMKRSAQSNGNFYVAPEAKVAFVVRLRGIIGVSPKVKKVLQLLRLRQIHNGVFIRVNKATMGMLKLIEPYVTYGYPNLKSIKQLIYKRGYGKVENFQRIPLTNNEMIEKHLGEYGIICMEDIIHELYTCGPHFKQVSNFLWPFKLTAPRGGMTQKKLHFNEGGEHGNREEEINTFLANVI